MLSMAFKWMLTSALMLSLTACLGAVVGTAVDVTLEVAKVPFKVAGAVIDVATKDEKDKD
jgi:hypothetical protein